MTGIKLFLFFLMALGLGLIIGVSGVLLFWLGREYKDEDEDI